MRSANSEPLPSNRQQSEPAAAAATLAGSRCAAPRPDASVPTIAGGAGRAPPAHLGGPSLVGAADTRPEGDGPRILLPASRVVAQHPGHQPIRRPQHAEVAGRRAADDYTPESSTRKFEKGLDPEEGRHVGHDPGRTVRKPGGHVDRIRAKRQHLQQDGALEPLEPR